MASTSGQSSKLNILDWSDRIFSIDFASPLIRTNPVTGWKSLFGAAGQVENGWINGVTERESEILKDYCASLNTQFQRVFLTMS